MARAARAGRGRARGASRPTLLTWRCATPAVRCSTSPSWTQPSNRCGLARAASIQQHEGAPLHGPPTATYDAYQCGGPAHTSQLTTFLAAPPMHTHTAGGIARRRTHPDRLPQGVQPADVRERGGGAVECGPGRAQQPGAAGGLGVTRARGGCDGDILMRPNRAVGARAG